ncbi:hypothetical protein [Suttonella ornithocola]|uniref:Large polyvalent protein-associated domain-containing protein n=1 Tax=Suttonella ornithocola TaxID=279832 RepID=A0A380MU05_9GAMM|nr:hypothetical protein [Suttonella ornithocola]SUO96099.1 Uncharacterised protein [Suttonella ornithocola]
MNKLRADSLEFSETFQRYGGVDGYAEAVEIGATQLPIDRWVQVRTETFKKEYGDWLFARDSRALRTAKNKGEAQDILRKLNNIELRNAESGLIATISKRTVEKMISSTAFKKSLQTTNSGFIHLAAVANVDTLFFNGILGWIKPDRAEAKQVIGLPRIFSPMTFEKSIYLVETTVKLLNQNYGGNRIYTVEAINILDKQQITDKFIADTEKGNASPIIMAETNQNLSNPNSLRSLGVSRVLNLAQQVIDFNSKNIAQQLNPYTFEPKLDFLSRSLPSPLIDLKDLGNREAGRKLHDSVDGDIAHLPLVILSAQAVGKQINVNTLIKAETLHPIQRQEAWLNAVRENPLAKTTSKTKDRGFTK